MKELFYSTDIMKEMVVSIINVLHISDLHYQFNDDQREFINIFLKDIEKTI